MKLKWVPETFPQSGGLAAEGFYKLLGRPRLDPLTVLVRETAQNSWDARRPDGDTVEFSIEGRELDEEAAAALRDKVFTDAAEVAGVALHEKLSAADTTGLYVCDRNTIGLGGPFRADVVDPGGVYDWVDFVLNVGKANTAGHTGGTYGFGKTISYIVSAVNAVVIHTRTMAGGRPSTRLIACAIGSEFQRYGRMHTGRHWWGRSNAGLPEPATGKQADELASQIGMPAFADNETGTNILIVAPDFANRTAEQAMRFIAESVTWHLWPKLTPREGRQPMRITVGWNGEDVAVAEPSERPPLHGFAKAFHAILNGADAEGAAVGTQVETISCQRPKTDAGDLATVPLVQRRRVQVDDGHDPEDDESPDPAAPITGPCHHVALLRTPELVVDYMAGPPPLEGGTEWAGVFRCRPEHDGKFAMSEPPTHDSWQPDLLDRGQERRVVNVALREIRRALDARWAPRSQTVSTDSVGTAVVANDLAFLVRTTDAKGPGRATKEPKGSKPTAAKIEFLSTGPVLLDDRPATRAIVRLTPAPGTTRTRLNIGVGVSLDGRSGDSELDPELQLIHLQSNGSTFPLSGVADKFDVECPEPIEFEVLVARGSGTPVHLDIRADPVVKS